MIHWDKESYHELLNRTDEVQQQVFKRDALVVPMNPDTMQLGSEPLALNWILVTHILSQSGTVYAIFYKIGLG
ncbi:hypothetical protein N7451_000502 [Penicillium sp. IBT 35674x]|nr:hypothetical protein N7451_000502 [Penicillium sp. IBT 35674x]